MSGLHLNHLIPWHDLLELFYVYADPGIKLPICECGRIQASEKKVQHQIKNRKYLDDQICDASNCKIVGEKIFRKTEKKKLEIPWGFYFLEESEDAKAKYFISQFKAAIKEFAETERKKIKDRNVSEALFQFTESYPNFVCSGYHQMMSFDPEDGIEKYCKEIEKRLKEEGKWPSSGDDFWDSCGRWRCSCKLFSVLIETGDFKTLLSFPNEKIEHALRCCHGQAIGWNFHFLVSHVVKVYCFTNFIIAANLQDKPDAWGPMKPDQYFRKSLMRDCDGQTFIFGCRKYLTDEIYMKDFGAMKELCKQCFQFIYILAMLENEVGSKWEITDTLFWK